MPRAPRGRSPPAARRLPRSVAGVGAENDSRMMLLPAAVHEERLAGDVDHAVLDGARDHRVAVDRRRAASPTGRTRRAAPASVTVSPNSLAQRFDHHVALLLVVRAQERQLALEHAAAARPRTPRADRARRCTGRGLLGHLELRGERRRRVDPRDAVARRQRLREAAQVDHPPVAIVRLDRPHVGFRRASPRSTARDTDRPRRSGRFARSAHSSSVAALLAGRSAGRSGSGSSARRTGNAHAAPLALQPLPRLVERRRGRSRLLPAARRPCAPARCGTR